MAYCTYCGAEISDQAAACPKCGHPRGGGAAIHRTEGTAIASLACGIAGFVACPVALHIAAIVLGNQARRRIEDDPTLEGESLARAGIVLGWVGVGLAAVVLLIILASFAIGVSQNMPG